MKTTIQNQFLTATIDDYGAELISLTKDQKNMIWTVNTEFWNKTSPVLFPTVGLLKDLSYEFNCKKYTLPRHGFARSFDFEMSAKTDSSVLFSLRYNNETLEVYPFLFELQIGYELKEHFLEISYQVINLSEEKMWFSLGAHPAFAIEGNFEDYSLLFDENKPLKTHKLHQELFSGETVEIPLFDRKLPLKYQLFERDAIVLKDATTQSLTLLKGENKLFSTHFSDFPYLGIWTKKNAPFVCIEPWLGIADNVNTTGKLEEKEGIQILEGNGKKTYIFSIEVF